MEQAELDTSKSLSFPPYRRSHLHSETYLTLIRIFSHLPATPVVERSQRKKKRNLSSLNLLVLILYITRMLSPRKKYRNLTRPLKGLKNKDRECVVNDIVLGDIEEIMGIEEVEEASRTILQDRCNDADKEQQRIMDELELAVNGTQNIVCDGGVIFSGVLSGEKQNDSRVVELMDYRLENDEFLHSDVKKCGNAGDMQVQGSRDQILSTSMQEQTSALVTSTSNINHENEMKMVCAAMDSLPNSKGEVGKKKKRRKRAEKNKQLGVKRLKLPLVQQKPKTINYCRHFLVGRCYEGDKCQFSHDTVPSTKSSPCSFFARHSCMKGDDCPFDHQLSKYPCDNFVSRGFCARGDVCLFSHKLEGKFSKRLLVDGCKRFRDSSLPAKEDIPTASKVCKPGTKSPHFSGNTNFNMPPNIHGYSSIQQNHLINSPRVLSHINLEHKVTNTVQKQPKLASKGVSFIDVAKLSSPTPTTPKEGMTKVGSSSADQSTSGTNQTSVEIPKKLPPRVPKGINFLAFGKDPVNSFKSSFKSLVNAENGIDVLQIISFGLLDHNNSSIKVDDGSKDIDGTKGRIPQTDLVSSEIFEKNQSVAESIKLSFPGKASMTDASTGLQGSPHVDDNKSKPVQEAKGATDLFQTSTAAPFMLLVSPLSSEQLPSRKELVSTLLSFAAEHELVIKKKDSAGTSTA
ncbi:hypothetical protein PIB30_031562 [Stylosanthes scabra]|uniref:C3H1-type domain-containing protein n=1 Tax=Stylosanthes scabra TaxID=79078 RepID=A0ABU6RC68_9FABA|nr:hypothetical protein [Stylosanthes scabra]